MTRKFITTLAAAAVALSSVSATPVMANPDRDRLARFLAGAATLIIIGTAINNSQASPRSNTQTHYNPHAHYNPRATPKPKPKPKPKPRAHHGKPPLPAKCVLRVPSRYGSYATLGSRCLNKNYRAARHLPQVCRESVKLKGVWRSAYKIRCLRDRGFRIVGR